MEHKKEETEIKTKKEPPTEGLCAGCGKIKQIGGMCIKCKELLCKDCRKECTTCHKIFCNKHITQCLYCKNYFCEECGIKHFVNCEECKRPLCRNKLFKCLECGEMFCKNHIKKCSFCKQYFCKDCIKKHSMLCSKCGVYLGCKTMPKKGFECEECLSSFCKYHLENCPFCKKPFCKECLKDHILKCNKCGQILGCKNEPKGATECNMCAQTFCDKHIKKCKCCKKYFCEKCLLENHFINCDECGKPLNRKEVFACARCDKVLCKDNIKKCSICGSYFCSKCLKEHKHKKFLWFFTIWDKRDKIVKRFAKGESKRRVLEGKGL